MTRRILITGATGFVGTYLSAALEERYPDASVISLVADGVPRGLCVLANLLDRAAVDAAMAQARPDIVIHLAAQTSVAATLRDDSDTFAVNLGGSLHLAQALASHVPEATLLFASSSEVYGASFLADPVTEASPPRPLNDYAKSKRLAEEMFAAVLPTSARLIVARPFNHTGAGQREDFALPSFARQVARIEVGRQEARIMVGNIDVRRDFLDVRDVVAAYLALIDTADLPMRLTCNIASGAALPLRTHVETLRSLSRASFEIVVDPQRLRPVDVPVAHGDAALLRALTGWTPKVMMAETLADLLESARADVSGSRSDAVLQMTA